MSKVSDEIRNWCELCGGIIDSYDRDKLCALIERVDAELVELPKDADGVPIHLGDTVYAHGFPDGKGGATCKVSSIELNEGDESRIKLDVGGVVTYRTPSSLTHDLPDSFERIADDLEGLSVDSMISDINLVSARALDLAKRIRRLAENKEDCIDE